MPASGSNQWQYLDPMGQSSGGVPGAASKTFPIRGNGPEPWFRDRLDALRSARIPTAMYPDGYLGTVKSRRQDRLRSAGGGTRLNQRNYQRGIHVGARVDPQSYSWSEEVHPTAGLEAQARGERWTQQGEYATHLMNDGKAGPARGSMSLTHYDEYLRSTYKKLAPGWR